MGDVIVHVDGRVVVVPPFCWQMHTGHTGIVLLTQHTDSRETLAAVLHKELATPALGSITVEVHSLRLLAIQQGLGVDQDLQEGLVGGEVPSNNVGTDVHVVEDEAMRGVHLREGVLHKAAGHRLVDFEGPMLGSQLVQLRWLRQDEGLLLFPWAAGLEPVVGRLDEEPIMRVLK